MKLVLLLVLFCGTSCVLGDQNLYDITLKDVKVEYLEKKYLDLKVNLYNLNATIKAVNLTITPKIDLPEDTKIVHKALKLHNNEYRYAVIQIEKRMKNALEMQSFDVQSICQEYTRPPAIWPLRKNVAYHLIGWVPNSKKFPANIPEGKWKLYQAIEFANGTKMLIANWFSEVHYRK